MSTGDSIRQLRLRHPAGFSEERWVQVIAHVRCWRAYVEALLDNWADIPLAGGPAPDYQIGEPQISADRGVITVELRGPWTLGSRALIEDGTSEMLWRYLPVDFLLELEEGLAEPATGGETRWRRALRPSSARGDPST